MASPRTLLGLDWLNFFLAHVQTGVGPFLAIYLAAYGWNEQSVGIFGVVSVLVIADLTQGSGRFNLTLGAINTAVGIGASLSQFIAGAIAHHFGTNAGFLFLAAIAAAALAILYCFMPETRGRQFTYAAQPPEMQPKAA